MNNNKNEVFIAEFENMDLSKLKDKTYIVAVSSGDRNRCKMLASTVHGPYDFLSMVEAVGQMWITHQHHAKVTILDPDPEKITHFLDENTTDYIEAKWQDIISESILLEDNVAEKKFTCTANTVESKDE